jgi:hypothetical protein
MQVPADAPSASRVADDPTLKKSLAEKTRELSQESWFDDLCELEKVEPEAVLTAVFAHIQKLGQEDNVYRLGENYWYAKVRLSQYRKIPISSYITAVLSLLLAGTIIVAIVLKASGGYIFAAVESFLLSLFFPWFAWEIRNRREGLFDAPAEYAKATTDIDRGIRSLMEQSVREVIRLHLVKPYDNVVKIGDGANLSSRVVQAERITTRYRPAVELHMLRSGGAAVGITGERGTGKSELLRSFCDITVGRATVKRGGTIGVLVAVPAAFQGSQFLALVAERLAQAVPGYRTPEKRREQRKLKFEIAAIVIGIILLLIGGFTFGGQVSRWKLTDHQTGSVTLAAGAVIFFVSYFALLMTIFRRLEAARERREPRQRKWAWLRNRGQAKAPVRSSRSAPARSRSRLGRDAERLMLRLKYAETVTSQSEGSVSGGGVGLKLGGQRTLSSLPLTEASLISEIKTLSDRLGEAGYRIIIGIDEMDKLEAGQATEDFLNSIKQLFVISSCSFLVSVSSSAWARFVQRGVNVRDALDSSLDAVEPIGALDFLETRSLILHRREAMSDSEILFCYVLAGGLPREVMRCAQSLAIRNRDAEVSSHTLDVLAGRVLNMELDRLIEASRSAVSAWEFHQRDGMFRKFDDIVERWEATVAVPVTADAANSTDRDTDAALTSSLAKSESAIIVPQLELMVQFFRVVRQLFCPPKKELAAVTVSTAEFTAVPASNARSAAVSPLSRELDEASSSSAEPAAANPWGTDVLKICDALAEVRRLIETDPTAALQQLSKAERQLDKEAARTPARIADLSSIGARIFC